MHFGCQNVFWYSCITMKSLELCFEKARRVARTLFVCGCVLFLAGTGRCHGQGTLHVTFDGPPPIAPGTAILVQQYFESGLSFRPINSKDQGFGRVGTQPRQERPDNGTSYLQAGLGSTLMFSFTNGSVFDLVSVDLAEYSTVVPNAVTVRFVGYRLDGSMIVTYFATDGIMDGGGPLADFQTFHFGSEFSSLTRVEIPTYGWSLDNLYVSVPEPGTGALMILGTALLGLRFNKRRKKLP